MLINLRNALMSGKRLPYDAEAEYLQSSGTQWIDTGINAKQSLKIRAVFETNASTSYFAYGVRAGNSTITCSTGIGKDLGVARWGASAYADAGPGGLVDITQDSSGVIVNGTSHRYNATQTVVEQSGYTMTLFAGRNSTTTVTANMVGKFNSCKIWDNGTLVRDFIPVRKGTVGYLYDRVSGKLFGNAGTGDFVVGPDVVPVEYIESHGTEYIDTGYIPNQQTRWELDYQFASIGTTALNGMFQLNPTVRFNMGQDSNGFFNISYGEDNHLSITADTLRHLFVMDVSVLQWRIDSNSGAFPGAVTNTLQNSLRIFCRNSPGGTVYNRHSGRCFASRMYQSDVLSQRILPVRVGTEGAMMDVLTRRIYRNAGTGAFTYGNDLKYPIPSE